MYVKDIMNQPVITCASDCDLNVAAQLMWEHDCGTIPVVDQDGRLAGMVTDRDICMAAYTQGLPLRAIPVTSAMTQYALACHLDDSVNTAEELMREGQIRRVPVIDNEGRPVGIVAVSDLTRFAANAKETNFDRGVVTTIAAISTPRFGANGEVVDRRAGLTNSTVRRDTQSR